MYVIEDFRKTNTQNDNDEVTHIMHMMYGRNEGVILSFTHVVGGLFNAGIKLCKA